MNQENIQRTCQYLGHLPVEVRIINPITGDVLYCGMVDNVDSMIQVCRRYNGRGNIYVGLNERRKDFVINAEVKGAKKSDIVAVLTIPIDIDAIRRGESLTPDELKELQKQPSTDTEMKSAIEAGKSIQMWFRQTGFDIPPMAMSGNGSTLWCAIPRNEIIPDNLEAWETKLKTFLIRVSEVIPPDLKDKVKIDTNVYDVTRILKVVGTKSVKGINTPERPHRLSYWIDTPVRTDDIRVLEYILSIDTSLSKPQDRIAYKPITSAPTQLSLPELSDYQKNVLQMALKAPYVVMARRRMNYSDLSKSDWAFLHELRKEGVTDRNMLIYALATCKDTKYERDSIGGYVQRTVDNFLSRLEGMTLQEGRDRLSKDMASIVIQNKDYGNKTIIYFIGAGISLGKTYNAIELVDKVRQAGNKVLVVIPLHIVGDEWFHQLQVKYGIHDVVQLYGITHEQVKCPHADKAKWLLSLGHSQLFKQRYCMGICQKRKDCLHLKSLEWAKGASVLIATHAHSGVHRTFYRLRSLDNDIRSLIIIDELPQFVTPVRFKREVLKANLELFKVLSKSDTDVSFDKFVELTAGLLNALMGRKDYEYPDALPLVSQEEVSKADFLIARYHIDNKKKPQQNIVWDLAHLFNTHTPVKYDLSQDSLIYRWTPDFRPQQTVAIMSGTTQATYIEKQLGRQVQSIGESWNIRRENVKIVQMLNVTGGRNRLIRQSEKSNLQAHVKTCFDMALYKHAGQPIAIVCSLGHNAPEGSAKERIVGMLNPIAKKHGRKLVNVSQIDIQQGKIPNGLEEIPVLHWGLLGIDVFKGRYGVIFETNGHYFHPDSIKQAVFEKFDHDISEVEPERKKVQFHSVDKTYDVSKYVYPDDITTQLEIAHSEMASVEQTEGRFLREDDIHKTIYRLHNANVTPYPHRVYKAWDALFEYEFYPFVPPDVVVESLSGNIQKVWNWIQQHGKEFTANDVAKGTRITIGDVKNRYLSKLVSLGLVEIVRHGGRGREQETVYRITGVGRG